MLMGLNDQQQKGPLNHSLRSNVSNDTTVPVVSSYDTSMRKNTAGSLTSSPDKSKDDDFSIDNGRVEKLNLNQHYMLPSANAYNNESSLFKDTSEPEVFSTYDKSLLLPISTIPCNVEPNEGDNAIEDLIHMLRPHDEQIKLRRSIQQNLMSFVKRHIGCRVFDSTVYAIKCFLPDDGIKLSLVMSRLVPNNWFLMLHDKLMKLSERSLDPSEFALSADDIDSDRLSDVDIDEEHSLSQQSQQTQRLPTMFESNVSNLTHSTNNGESNVSFNIDSLLVEIDSNPRLELGMMSFLEEFANLVGRGYMFKKCFLLVRAWWIYETAAYIGCPMKHYLSDTTLAVMLCAVFNLYQ